MKQYDAIIIGFGKAGKTLAAELSNRGWQVAIVERSNMMYGGSCPNVACIPTKTLVHEPRFPLCFTTMIFRSRRICTNRPSAERTASLPFLGMIITKD